MQKQTFISRTAFASISDKTLIGLGFLVVDLAGETLAERDIESARALVGLAMSVLHEARTTEAGLKAAVDRARLRLDALNASLPPNPSPIVRRGRKPRRYRPGTYPRSSHVRTTVAMDHEFDEECHRQAMLVARADATDAGLTNLLCVAASDLDGWTA